MLTACIFHAKFIPFTEIPMIATPKPDRLTAIDLSHLTDEQMQALRQEAMQRGVSMSELIAQLIMEVTRRQHQNQPAA